MENNNQIPNTQENIREQTPIPPQPVYVQVPYSTYPQPAMRKPKKEITFSKKDKIFMGLFTFSSALIVFFGLFGGFALGLTVSVWLLSIVTAIYLKDNGKFSVLSVSALFGTLVSSVSFTLYGMNGMNLLLAMALTLACYTVFAVSMCDQAIFDSISGTIKYIFITLFSPFVNIAMPIKGVVSKDKEKRKSAIQVLAAVAVAFPVLCVVIPLLVSSDAAFEGLVSGIAEKIGITLVKILITALIAVLLMAFVVTNRFDLFTKSEQPTADIKRPFNTIFTGTLLSLISVVYVAFLFSQLAYFVNSFKGLLPAGYTFADYARRGFFETETVAFINLSVIVILMWLTKRNEKGELSKLIKALMTFVSLFSIFFIATAIAKMAMYIKTYGLTELRLFTSVFMVATVAFIVSILVKIYKVNANTIKYAIAFSLVIFSCLSAVGLERTVASYNVNAYTNGLHKNIDIEYLYNLGDTAMPYIAKLIDVDDKEVSKTAQNAIEYNFYCYYIFSDNGYETKNGVVTVKGGYLKDYRFNLLDYQITKMCKVHTFSYNENGTDVEYPFQYDE